MNNYEVFIVHDLLVGLYSRSLRLQSWPVAVEGLPFRFAFLFSLVVEITFVMSRRVFRIKMLASGFPVFESILNLFFGVYINFEDSSSPNNFRWLSKNEYRVVS